MSSARLRRPGELAFVLLLVLFSLLAAWQAWTISGFSSLSSPGVFPMFAAATMLVSGLVILKNAVGGKTGSQRPAAAAFFDEITPVRLLVFSGMIIAYMVALEPAGFLVSSFAFLFASMAYLYRVSILLSLVISAASLAVIFVVFRYVFTVVLPEGRLL